ncbi:Nonribosomal peptide synthetase lcsA [Cladobotryum mycophilum]|uniref:Nonribosomal peptide synthetase lcsA n=1 Tax=Cladobotryum mycophilum TaxID=491253 RepID=A0ABR0SI44_9HYPO
MTDVLYLSEDPLTAQPCSMIESHQSKQTSSDQSDKAYQELTCVPPIVWASQLHKVTPTVSVSALTDSSDYDSESTTSDLDLERSLQFNAEVTEVVDSCVHQLIENQATRNPDAPAIHAWDREFTYRELSEASNRLAHHLIGEYNVKANDLVHVCFEHSAWFFVAILAINKAGAAWVPLDPSHPEQRLKQVVAQTRAALALSSVTHAQVCAGLVGTVVEVCSALDQLLIGNGVSSAILENEMLSSSAAYVLFTSGSTGTPKGLVMEHLSVCTSQSAIAKRLGITPDVRILQFAAYVFDLSIGEIYAPLITGACLCVPSGHTRMNGLEGFIRDMNVTWAFLTPSFVRTITPQDVPSLKLLLLCGEAIPHDVFRTWVGKVRLINGWGPAETCVFSTLHEWKSADESPLTIGRPVGGHCWIVDPEDPHRLAPIGTMGEIMIQGPTILREYLADPEKTKRAIITSLPEWAPRRSSKHWSRFFKSGDLGYYRPDGTIEFSTRKDTQVKIRGLRVELGEVEHCMWLAFHGIRQLAVDVLETNAGSNLVAYFSFGNEMHLGNGNKAKNGDLFLKIDDNLKTQLEHVLRELAATLPGYMIPTYYIPCGYFPSITSTKLDRRTLKEQTALLPQEDLHQYSLSSNGKEAPQTPMERKIQKLWSEALSIPTEAISRHANFLKLGGDSISAIKLVAAARCSGFRFTVKDIFDEPELSALALKSVETKLEGKTIAEAEPFDLLEETAKTSLMMHSARADYGLPEDAFIEDAYPCTPTRGTYGTLEAWEYTLHICCNLRTRIVLVENTPVQLVIRDDASWDSTEGLDLQTYRRQSQNCQMTYGTRLCRYAIVNEEGGEAYFAWAVHHAIFDGWALSLILNTLASAYRQTQCPIIYTPSSFVKYTRSLDYEAANKYWASQLQGAKRATFPEISRGTRLSRPRIGTTRSFSQTMQLAHSKTTPITKATILRAAWALLLARYCDTEDVCFGTTVSGRNAPIEGVESVSGLVAATVPVRVRIDQQKSISAFLQETQHQASAMAAHEQLGLQNISKLGAEAKAACDFTSLFVVQPNHQLSAQVSSFDLIMTLEKSDEYPEEEIHYPLVIQAYLLDDQVKVDITYHTDSVSDFRARVLCQHFQHIAEQLLVAENRLVGAVSVAGPWDLQQAIRWNKDSLEPIDECLHHLISRQAERLPNHEAVYSSDGCFTYQELDRLTTKFAIRLIQLGVQVETCVPFCMEKSKWTIIAMIGILKAGGIFVPLDPAHPLGRRQACLGQMNADFLVVSPSTAEECENMVLNTIVLSPSLISGCTTLEAEATPLAACSPKNAAYMLFTSGSTGKPKGVVVEHKAACSSLLGQQGFFCTNEKSRWLQFANYSFDACITEIFGALVTGGAVCVPNEWERLHETSAFINKAEVNITMLTPTFINTLQPDSVPSLESVILIGEAPTKKTLETWYGYVDLYNGYGPTEACILSSTYRYKSAADSATNIGHGFVHQCWIVDPRNHHQLAPIGCVGELLLQGHALARSYLHHQQSPNGPFIDDVEWLPSTTDAVPRKFYKTGDLVRYNDNGTMEYLGRKDTQAKIRGQRIEVGEIEYQIRKSESEIEYAVVEVIHHSSGEALVAFITLASDQDTNSTMEEVKVMIYDNEMRRLVYKLMAKLRVILPAYMIPSYVIPVESMPQSSAGKLNRKILLQTAVKMPSETIVNYLAVQRGSYRACSTEMEFWVRSEWAQTLNLPPDSINGDDNFYDLGGDSIRIITVINSIVRRFGISFGMSMINSKHTTVGGMAKAIQNILNGSREENESQIDLMAKISQSSVAIQAPHLDRLADRPLTVLPDRATVFLTGATGFLGTELLRQLVRSASVKTIITLVRSRSVQHGLNRIKNAARISRWWREEDAEKIEIWPGDLGATRMGLTSSQWDRLSGRSTSDSVVDAIIHNGAVVNWNADYDKLSVSNVESTVELLQAAVSSAANPKFVFVSGGIETSHQGDDRRLLASQLSDSSGYCQTKFVCDGIIEDVIKQLPVGQNRISSVKPGRIIGSPDTGVCNLDDFIWRIVAGAALIGAHPVDSVDTWMHIADVATVATAILDHVFTSEEIESFANVSKGMPVRTFWGLVNSELGNTCAPLPWNEWTQRSITSLNEIGENHPLWPVQHFLEPFGISRQLEELGEEVVDERESVAVKRSVRYLRQVDFIQSSTCDPAELQHDTIRRIH